MLAYRGLFAVNSEAIHFVQYGILALLLIPLVRRCGETIVLVTLLGILDEAYQYWVLHGDWGVYYDFNDVVLNLLGAAMGVLVPRIRWKWLRISGVIWVRKSAPQSLSVFITSRPAQGAAGVSMAARTRWPWGRSWKRP